MPRSLAFFSWAYCNSKIILCFPNHVRDIYIVNILLFIYVYTVNILLFTEQQHTTTQEMPLFILGSRLSISPIKSAYFYIFPLLFQCYFPSFDVVLLHEEQHNLSASRGDERERELKPKVHCNSEMKNQFDYFSYMSANNLQKKHRHLIFV